MFLSSPPKKRHHPHHHMPIHPHLEDETVWRSGTHWRYLWPPWPHQTAFELCGFFSWPEENRIARGATKAGFSPVVGCIKILMISFVLAVF